MTNFREIDITTLGVWLLRKCEDSRGDGTVAEIITQLLESPLGYALFTDSAVREGLHHMMESNDVHIGLNAMNVATTLLKDDLARTYLQVLSYEHSCLESPPFAYTDSLLWYYRDWRVSQFDMVYRNPSDDAMIV